MSFFIKESPRWLMMNNRPDEALEVLEYIANINQQDFIISSKTTKQVDVIKETNIWELCSKKFRLTTGLLWVLWFVSAFNYYGIVILSVEMVKTTETHICGMSSLTESNSSQVYCLPIPEDRYIDIVTTSLGELPGILLTTLLVDKIGRKNTMLLEYSMLGLLLLPLCICLKRKWFLILMFILRSLITGAYQVLYVYTPEVYPTLLRSSGLGIANSVGRIGGMITPYMALVVTQLWGELGFLFTIAGYALAGFIAALCAFLLPIETIGRPLDH